LATRKEKREEEKNKKYFFEFMKIQNHFYKDLNKKLKQVKDPRHQSYITYDPEIILMMVIIKNASNIETMREMTDEFNSDICIDNLSRILGIERLDEIPHYDTVNDFLSRLQLEELENIRTYMIKELINKKCFYDYRIDGKYWGIVIDGTGLFTFREKHCEHCLKREYKNEETGEKKTVYMHHVLEAKLVVGDLVFSIASEFIENESEDVEKQDCELNAFYRMEKKLKHTFKRLPICIIADSLYACENVFKLCDKNKWKYLIRFKEGSIKSVMKEFQKLRVLEDNNSDKGISWVNDIPYNERTVNVLEFVEEMEKDNRTFTYITNIKVGRKNAKGLINAGRSRWKIENEGFNNQKNIRYYIQHANSHDYNAMKNHYLLTQITDILVQLFENGSKIMKMIKKKAKKRSSDLLRAFQTLTLTEEDLIKLEKPIQVRFT
jgi:hypothetical protein